MYIDYAPVLHHTNEVHVYVLSALIQLLMLICFRSPPAKTSLHHRSLPPLPHQTSPRVSAHTLARLRTELSRDVSVQDSETTRMLQLLSPRRYDSAGRDVITARDVGVFQQSLGNIDDGRYYYGSDSDISNYVIHKRNCTGTLT